VSSGLRTLRLPTSWGALTLVGGSRAGEATLVLLPQLRLALDAGRPHRALPPMSTVVVSHGHVDHIGGLATWASQRELNAMGPGRVVAPSSIAGRIESLLRIHADLEGSRGYAVEVVPASVGATVDLRRDMHLEFFATDHVVPSLGTRVVWTRHRRMEAFAEFPPEELARLRREGTTITEPVRTTLLAATGDTGVGLFSDVSALDAEVLLIECSFYAAGEEERARRWGHLHLTDLVDHLDRLRCRHLVLLHPSRRHRLADAVATATAALAGFPGSLHHLMVEWD
jgi:ribonuclease Z